MGEWLLEGEPYSVQLEALRRSAGKPGFLYWLEVGLGKSAIVLAEFERLRQAGEVDTLMIVTLDRLKFDWRDIHVPTFAPWLTVATWDAGRWRCDTGDADVFVMNYESLIASGGKTVSGIMAASRPMLAIDECHRIRSPSSQWSKKVLTVAKDARVTRGLSGTPSGGTVMDLYPQLRLARARELNGVNPYSFRNRFAKLGGFMGKQVIGVREDTKPELDHMIECYAFRARKAEYTDLPPQLPPVTLRAEMPKGLAARYREMASDFVVMLDKADPADAATARMVITQMLKLQQISSGYVLDDESKPRPLTDLSRLPKMLVVRELLEEMDSKLIVFCYFRFTAQMLQVELTPKEGQAPALMLGGMAQDEFRRQRDSFNSDDGPQVLVAQLAAGGVGHTLLGGPTRPCYTSVFYENSYNLIDRDQSEGRNHRFGQHKAVTYIDIVSSRIEARAVAALQQKRTIVDALINDRRNLS